MAPLTPSSKTRKLTANKNPILSKRSLPTVHLARLPSEAVTALLMGRFCFAVFLDGYCRRVAGEVRQRLQVGGHQALHKFIGPCPFVRIDIRRVYRIPGRNPG